MIDGKLRPADGELYYRGYNVKDIIDGTSENSHFGFEECTYLLLFGKLPARTELTELRKCSVNIVPFLPVLSVILL